MICDSNYPELATDMVARGASAISRVGSARAVDIARARDNEVMIVRADVARRRANRISFGSSAIVDARGTVLRVGEASREDVLVVEVNTEGTEVRTDACGPNVRFVSWSPRPDPKDLRARQMPPIFRTPPWRQCG